MGASADPVGGMPAPPDAATMWWGDLASVSPDLLLVVRIEGAVILAANAAWRRMLGLEPDDLLGHDQRSFVHPDDRLAAHEALRDLGPCETCEFAHRIADAEGRWRWIWWMATMDASGTVIHGSGRDITERQAAYESAVERHDRLAQAERVGRMGSFSWQRGARVATVSPELRRITGLEDLGEHIEVERYFDTVHPDDRGRLIEALLEALETGRSFELEYRIQPFGGPPLIVRGHAGVVRGGDGHVRIVGTVRDVTEQRRMEAGLRRALASEQQVVEELERLDRIKSAFLRAVSHELRTPATVIRGMADTLMRLRGEAPEETIHRLERALSDNAEKLADLLEDLLDVDRIGQTGNAAGRSRFDAVAAITEVLRDHRGHAVHFDGPTRLDVEIDRFEFERIVVNLLDNARKYAPQGRVDVQLTGREDGGLRLDVRDDGPGIPDGERQHVFEPFHRLDAEDHRPGTGIGLALVAAFAEAHGGAAWVEPSRVGAHLVVVLPGPVGEDERPGPALTRWADDASTAAGGDAVMPSGGRPGDGAGRPVGVDELFDDPPPTGR